MILAAEGRYAQLQVNPDGPKIKGKTRLDGTPEENKAAMAGTVAHFGTWSVNEAEKTLIMRSEGNLFPNDEGSEFEARRHPGGRRTHVRQSKRGRRRTK